MTGVQTCALPILNREDWESAKSKASSSKVFDACLKKNGRMKGHEGPLSGTN